ncbi:IclR family transcriptional regulator [Rubrobacter xylanophilus]|uniref:IclR family transcriptional regulator n=1 Tax=Rubrobacter xylanophilus TaxID=49319 RepID=UPI001179D28F|nr:IclR family transcriptional regulator [Rubrobacter xylanophilus]
MVHTLKKAAQILELFSAERPEWGVREVGRELDIPKSTAHALMSSMADEGLLHRTDKGHYQLGWRLFELSQILLDATQIRVAARAVMQDLIYRLGETVHLAILDGVQAVYIEKLPRVAAENITSSRKGCRRPAHCSAVGKVLLAHREWEDIEPLLRHQGIRARTPNTISTLEELRTELERIRSRGYAYDNEETSLGVSCVGAPVYNDRDGVIAAVSLAVPTHRFKHKRTEYTAAILEAAHRISRIANRGMGTYTERTDHASKA